VIAAVLIMPWALGLGIAFSALRENKLGDFRGLLCYNTEWDTFATGGITITVFFVATAITVVFYTLTVLHSRLELRAGLVCSLLPCLEYSLIIHGSNPAESRRSSLVKPSSRWAKMRAPDAR
jgi:hypothetical protein